MVTLSQDLVFGREDDKKAILQFLFDESISVIAIWGIGGIGKTTLARLVCDDDEVHRKFGQVWWASVPKKNDKEEITEIMVESITEKNHLTFVDYRSGMEDLIARNVKFLFVIDDVGDEEDFGWMSWLCRDEKGSKIIMTTRSSSVAMKAGANDKYKTLELGGLSESSSWKLFKSLALTQEKQNDPKWRYLGREIVKKCGNIPSVIKEMASTLSSRSNEAHGRQFVFNKLFEVEASEDPSIMSCITLKLNYKALPTRVKDCFAYCFLFPKNLFFGKEEIVQLWIAQGYIPGEPLDPLEDVGNAYFMQLLRRGFFEKEPDGPRFRMNPMIHDLLKYVNSEETECLTTHTVQYSGKIRHLAIEYGTDDSRQSLPLLPDSKQLQSLLILKPTSIDSSVFAQRITIFKSLRALGLRGMVKLELPGSIKELEQLRYLDISNNHFKALPDSITALEKLLTLDISGCKHIEKLPNGFRNLTKLRNLYNRDCLSLRHFPPGFEELSSLQRLSYFKVEEATQIGMWVRLKLKGDLTIEFDNDVEDWDKAELTSEFSQLSTELSVLRIQHYPGEKIDLSPLCNLVDLHLDYFKRTRHLAPLRRLCFLKHLALLSMDELEYIEEDEGGEEDTAEDETSDKKFFPCLVELELSYLPKLRGWSNKGREEDCNHFFPVLSFLKIQNCPELLSIPASPHLQKLKVELIDEELMQLLVPQLSKSSPLTNIPSSSLKSLTIVYCYWLTIFQGEALASLEHLKIVDCIELKYLKLPPTGQNLLKGLTIESCPMLDLWEEVEWDSLISLHELRVDEVPYERLPPSFVKLQDRGVQVLELW